MRLILYVALPYFLATPHDFFISSPPAVMLALDSLSHPMLTATRKFNATILLSAIGLLFLIWELSVHPGGLVPGAISTTPGPGEVEYEWHYVAHESSSKQKPEVRDMSAGNSTLGASLSPPHRIG